MKTTQPNPDEPAPSSPAAGMTRGQVARRLEISPERVRQLSLDGRLKCIVTPLGRLYATEDVERLARRRAQARLATPDD